MAHSEPLILGSDVREPVQGANYTVLEVLHHTDSLVRVHVQDESGEQYWLVLPVDAEVDVHFPIDPIIYLDEHAPDLVARYFNGSNGAIFSGRMFERLGGGGDEIGRRDVFDSDDLVAVSLLSVPIPPEAAIWILGDGSEQLSDLLRQIPADVALHEVDESVVADRSPTDRLWHVLMEQTGIGPVRAGKLCARKRPHLLPVYDTVLQDALGHPEHFWRLLHEWIILDAHRKRLEEVHDEARVGPDVSLLRTLDVAIWMRKQGAPSLYPPPSG